MLGPVIRLVANYYMPVITYCLQWLVAQSTWLFNIVLKIATNFVANAEVSSL